MLKGMLQSPRLKYRMKTIGIDQSFSNSTIFEQRYLQNIKKLYKHAEKCDNQQQFKDVLEAAMVSTTEGINDNTSIYPMTPQHPRNQVLENHCIFSLTYSM